MLGEAVEMTECLSPESKRGELQKESVGFLSREREEYQGNMNL